MDSANEKTAQSFQWEDQSQDSVLDLLDKKRAYDRERQARYRRLNRDKVNAQARESYARRSARHQATELSRRKEIVTRAATEALEKLARQPQTLSEWFPTQVRFCNWTEVAREVGVNRTVVYNWRDGKVAPRDSHRKKLFEITALECYAPRLMLQTDGLSTAFAALLDRAGVYLYQRYRSRNSRQVLGRFFTLCFRKVVNSGVANPDALTPSFLLRTAPHILIPRKRRWALKALGSFLVEAKQWSQSDLQVLTDALNKIFPRQRTLRVQSRSRRVVPLLSELLFRCGFSLRHVRTLKVPYEEAKGIRFDSGQFISFGKGWHEVGRDSFASWIAEAQPTDFLFFHRRPWNKHKPASEMWLRSSCGYSRSSGAFRTYRMQHFQDDFGKHPHPTWLRLHLQNFHGMHQPQAYKVVGKLQRKIGVYLPVPYLVAAVAVSQCGDGKVVRLKGGEVSTLVLECEGYKISARCPSTFVEWLKDRRVRPKIARELLRLGLAAWEEQRKLHKVGQFAEVDRRLIQKLERIHVRIDELESGRNWQAYVIRRRRFFKLEYSGRGKLEFRHANRRYFDLPLLEDLQGGVVKGRCKICGHPERLAIDEAIRTDERLSSIAERHGIQWNRRSQWYRHLLWHAGKITPQKTAKRAIQEKLPSHVSSAMAARFVRIPSDFLSRIARNNAPQLANEILSLCRS